jgi:uncharacterized protein (TIGR02246 family)
VAAAACEGIVRSLEAAWNDGDSDRFASYFAEDADFEIFGMNGKGRAWIADAHYRILHGVYTDSVAAFSLMGVCGLSEDVAVGHVESKLWVPQGPMAGQMESIPSLVAVRRPGGWEIAAFQSTMVNIPPALYERPGLLN